MIGPLSEDFHVVFPSLPGYGFSDKPAEPGWGVERIAGAWAELMARLGYERYGASGSDWGTSVSTLLGQRDREHVVGIHLVPPLAPPDPATFDDLTEAEREALAALEHAAEWDSGYSKEHSTRPQTIGYGLTDSPALLCAWIVEKLLAWSDEPLTRDQMLDNVTLYWLHAHRRIVRAAVLGEHPHGERVDLRHRDRDRRRAGRLLGVPAGSSSGRRAAGRSAASPTSATGASRTAAATSPRCEQPELFVAEVGAAFRTLAAD